MGKARISKFDKSAQYVVFTDHPSRVYPVVALPHAPMSRCYQSVTHQLPAAKRYAGHFQLSDGVSLRYRVICRILENMILICRWRYRQVPQTLLSLR